MEVETAKSQGCGQRLRAVESACEPRYSGDDLPSAGKPGPRLFVGVGPGFTRSRPGPQTRLKLWPHIGTSMLLNFTAGVPHVPIHRPTRLIWLMLAY